MIDSESQRWNKALTLKRKELIHIKVNLIFFLIVANIFLVELE